MTGLIDYILSNIHIWLALTMLIYAVIAWRIE